MKYKNICKNCNSKNLKKFFYLNENSANFFECVECGLIWLDELEWPSGMENHYSSVYYSESYNGRSNLNEAFDYRFNIFDKYIPAPGKVLEIGAASGDFLSMLKDRGYDVYGVELSKRASAKAKENYDIDIDCGTLKDSNFGDNFFDFIVMYHSLEHIPDPIAVLKEAHRILKSGGILLIEVPDPKSLDAKMSRRLLLSILDYPHHLYAFPKKVLKSMAAKSGFTVLHIENTFSFWVYEVLNKIKSKIRKKSKTQSNFRTYDSSKINDKKNKKSSLATRAGKKIFPGMKLTILLKK